MDGWKDIEIDEWMDGLMIRYLEKEGWIKLQSKLFNPQ